MKYVSSFGNPCPLTKKLVIGNPVIQFLAEPIFNYKLLDYQLLMDTVYHSEIPVIFSPKKLVIRNPVIRN